MLVKTGVKFILALVHYTHVFIVRSLLIMKSAEKLYVRKDVRRSAFDWNI